MKLDIDRVPADLDQAIEFVLAGLEPAERELIRTEPPFGAHRHWLSNAWSLGDGEAELVRWFIDNLRIGQADDISATIMAGVWAHIRNLPFEPEPIAKRYREHWLDKGCDPLTGKRNRGNDDS